VRDTAPTPRRRRVAEVAVPPVREAKPPPWINDRWAQPTKCQVPVDIDDLAKGVCGVEFTPVGNQQTCGSPACVRKLALIADRRRSGTYRENHREEVRARNCSPEAYRKHKERRDRKKASQPPIWNTCRWWSVIAAGAPIKTNQYRCPAREGQFQAKRKNAGFCSEKCKYEHKKYYDRTRLNNDYKANPEKYKAKDKERAPYYLNWSRKDRKAKPEKYWLKSHEQWLQRKAARPPVIIYGECGHSFEHSGPGRKPKRCPDCR
jgi:hypothetical protein